MFEDPAVAQYYDRSTKIASMKVVIYSIPTLSGMKRKRRSCSRITIGWLHFGVFACSQLLTLTEVTLAKLCLTTVEESQSHYQ